MINGGASHPAGEGSRMLGWGRILLVGGCALVFVTFGSRLAGSPKIDGAQAAALLWCGGGAAVTGALLAALGAIEQRLIENRALLLTAIERLKSQAPTEPHFRSRPVIKGLARSPWRQR